MMGLKFRVDGDTHCVFLLRLSVLFVLHAKANVLFVERQGD